MAGECEILVEIAHARSSPYATASDSLSSEARS
jgi:hypothetical protein